MILLSSISTLGPFSTDSYVPNMPQMAGELRCSQFQAGMTMQVNILIGGVAKVVVGCAADRLGRRPTLLVSLTIFTTASVACSLAPSVAWLIAARGLQGVGEAGAAVPMAVMRDVLDGPMAALKPGLYLWS